MNYDYLIVGGGVLGQAVAWALVQRLEQMPLSDSPSSHGYLAEQPSIGLVSAAELCNGTTAQAAALVTQGRGSVAGATLVQDTLKAIKALDAELELGMPFQCSGGLHIAANPKEHQGLVRMAQIADEVGAEYQWLERSKAQRKVPEFSLSQFHSALWFPDDGYIDPVLLANGYGEWAKSKGVCFHLNSPIDELLTETVDHKTLRTMGVKLQSGEYIKAKHLIVCAGPWAAKLLKPLRCSIPVAPVRSVYWMTEPLSKAPSLPVTIVPSARSYFRKENQSVLFGVRDCPGQSLHPDHVPDDVLAYEFPHDSQGLDALTHAWTELAALWPQIEELGLAHFISGLSSYSLDGLPVVGEPIFHEKSIKGLTVVTGCSGAGVAYSAGIAQAAAEHALTRHSAESFSAKRFLSDGLDLNHSNSIHEPCAYNEAFRQRCLQARSNKKAG